MVYSVDMKRVAVRLVLQEKKTLENVCETLKIGLTTLKRWLVLHKEGTLFTPYTRPKGDYKLDEQALIDYVSAYSDNTLDEMAAYFHLSRSCIYEALKRLGVGYKENAAISRTR